MMGSATSTPDEKCFAVVSQTAVIGRDPRGITGASHGPPWTALGLVKGSFRYWWQVQGSNLGRLSRRFYRYLPNMP
jgi:hypothetical protein